MFNYEKVKHTRMLNEINCQKIFFRNQKFTQNYLKTLRNEI